VRERVLLLMNEHGIDQVVIVDADTTTPDVVAITRAGVEQDEDAAALVFAIITRHDHARLGAVAPTLLVSTNLVEEIVAELDHDRS
jgi:hypothetical protein